MIRTERELRASLSYRDALRADKERALVVSELDDLAREWVVAGIDRALDAVEAELAEYEEHVARKQSRSSDAGSHPAPSV
jgi:hypothetical protein